MVGGYNVPYANINLSQAVVVTTQKNNSFQSAMCYSFVSKQVGYRVWGWFRKYGRGKSNSCLKKYFISSKAKAFFEI